MNKKKEIEKIILDYTDGWNEPHFVEWFGQNSKRGPRECIERLCKLMDATESRCPNCMTGKMKTIFICKTCGYESHR